MADDGRRLPKCPATENAAASKDMTESCKTYEDFIRRLKARAPASKRQKTGESSRIPLVLRTRSLRSHDSSLSLASTTVDPPTRVVDLARHASAPAPPTPTAPLRWIVDLPPTGSILRGDLATDEFMRSFLLPRDLELCEGNPDPRPILEAFIRHLALGDTLRATQARLEVEKKARLDLESRLQVSETKRKSLEDKYAQLQTLRTCENYMHGKVLASMLSDYKSSKAFKEDARKYLVENMEELFADWAATPAGRDRICMEGLLMYDVGQYTLQRDIYAILRNRDKTFDPVEWGLPAKFENPDLVASAEPTEAVKEEMAAGSPRE